MGITTETISNNCTGCPIREKCSFGTSGLRLIDSPITAPEKNILLNRYILPAKEVHPSCPKTGTLFTTIKPAGI